MHAVDSGHAESRSLTTGNFNIRFFNHSLLFFSFVLTVKRQDKTKIYDFEFQCSVVLWLACVQTSPLPQEKSGEDFLTIFSEVEGRLYTGYTMANH